MASEQHHQNRSRADYELARMILESGENLHWSVAVAFYSVLHMFDAYLMLGGIFPAQLTKSHGWRKRQTSTYLDKTNRERYIALFAASMEARYFDSGVDPAQFSGGQASRYLQQARLFNDYLEGQFPTR